MHTDRQTYRERKKDKHAVILTDNTDIHTDRGAYTETKRQAYMQGLRHAERNVGRQTKIHTPRERDTYIHTYLHTYIQTETHRQTDRQGSRQANIEISRQRERRTRRHSDREADKETPRHIYIQKRGHTER